jgi:hypothetical protein
MNNDYIHACMRTYIHMYIHTHIQVLHLDQNELMEISPWIREMSNLHTYIHIHIHTCTCTYIHTGPAPGPKRADGDIAMDTRNVESGRSEYLPESASISYGGHRRTGQITKAEFDVEQADEYSAGVVQAGGYGMYVCECVCM